MVQDKREIERRLQALLDSSNTPPSCSSTGFRVVAIISILILAGVFVGGAIVYFKAESAKQEAKRMKDLTKEAREHLDTANLTLHKLTEEFHTLEGILSTMKIEHANAQNQTDEMKKKIALLQTDLETLKKQLEEATKERDQLKQVHDGLKNENDRLNKEIIKLNYEIQDLVAHLNTNITRLDEWKLFSGIGLLAGSIGALEDIFTHAKYWQVEAEVKIAEVHKLSFNNLSHGAENYELVKRLLPATVSRETCFHNAPKANLSHCAGMRPTLTTITTTTGYRFSVFLNAPWPSHNGDTQDLQSFAMSANHGMAAKLKDVNSAVILNDHFMFQFGSTGIKIENDGISGTAYGGSYEIPLGFDKDHFFHAGPQFNITDLKIERISTQEQELTAYY